LLTYETAPYPQIAHMKKSPKKTVAGQFEFTFVRVVEITPTPPLTERSSCVAFVPPTKTVRPWVPIFADRPPTEYRFCPQKYRHCRRSKSL
jgi:hypothetical protein